jgi:3-hydroxymyristoyl/3-hydroxydecanoyl-(acyl carrier protein) dehydratase
MGNTTTLVIPPQHPAFGGHFPGAPLVPGVVLLDEMLRTLEVDGLAEWSSGSGEGWTLASAKFLHPVKPGETVTFEHKILPNGSIRFTIRSADSDNTLVASGTLIPRLPTREHADGHETG